ncbi:transmembrane and coiled-coil domain-containing protein 4-like isoform X1 [Solanum tuberosum]|uniref:Transmembrane and coiled-coil domain-containing protein 4 n=1 Tax=Solanum tuberosum TaxID=4113 RepID=M1C221_SOLTU|nr:PREDICTED: transmembrane and coiled-coil domain-containing protein 4-like isoform X1 [Solanum tuberosum]
MSSSLMLPPTHRYAAGALFGLALHQAQIHQTCPLGFPDTPPEERSSSGSSADSVSDDPQLWVHESSALLRPIFKFLEIDDKAWSGLEETAASTPPKHHVGAFLRLLSEESDDGSSEAADMELALANGVDAMASSMERTSDNESNEEKRREYKHECEEKLSIADVKSKSDTENTKVENYPEKSQKPSSIVGAHLKSVSGSDEKPVEEVSMLGYTRKVTILYELLSACLAQVPEDGKKTTRRRKGYDARHRVALRLLATWLNVRWIKVEAIETMVACSAMALLKEEESKEESQSPDSSWVKWKRGGIIGAAALTGGTLMAITGGLAAPAIAAGFGALAPTLGTLIPVIGASGFAAVATAAGSVAGSVAVAASFGAAGAGLTGTKMARRTGDVDEFEFKAIGENHNQGRLAVQILISGLIFEEEDFIRPWEGQHDNSERYILQWESKNLIAVSTAIQDWLTSRIAMELMKQGAMMTVLHTLLIALAWPAALLTITDFIDSTWSIAVDRSDKAGVLLAEVLKKGLQGHRPVTLVGFSLGARVIFKCLQVLAESENNSGLVERVVLLGAPIAIKDMDWEAARKVVAGRFVNAYSTNDWMLGVAFRASLLTQGLAGIQPVEIPGVENVDVTEFIKGHSSYLWATQEILELLELDTYYPVFGHRVVKT